MTQPDFRSPTNAADAAPSPRPDAARSERPSFYILDAYSLIYQVFHAIPLMTGPGGPADARGLRDRPRPAEPAPRPKPAYLAAAFDGGGPVFRSEIFAEYKAPARGDARRPASRRSR